MSLASLTLVPQASEMAVAAITETTRAALMFFSDMLALRRLLPLKLGWIFQNGSIGDNARAAITA